MKFKSIFTLAVGLICFSNVSMSMTCNTFLDSKKVDSFFHPTVTKNLEINLALGVHQILLHNGIFVLINPPKTPMQEVFNFEKGSRDYAKEVVDRLSPEHKAEIVDYLFASQINHYKPSSEFLTNARWQFNTEVVYGPWLDRLLTGRNTGNHVFTEILASRNEKELRRFINENIDSIIQNGIAIRTLKYPLILQRALSLCVGYACSMLLQDDPTVAFTLLTALPARELLRRERPFIFGFKSNFN